ncbi:unnamed protein product [Chrysodeixis includens]|uniref:Amino acid transporter transmembrane domain-containing protein n=1 Tax=Chrysodeixis includens TaxID=689277 RepID=A0A9P0FQG0_CHRIL|nr:unnamed protein product [Chrysodeixis includens]
MWRPAGLLQCVPIFSMALFCQTQLFEIFESLPSLSLEKMNVVTKNAINICTAVYFTLGVFGYIAFSSQDISGNILMSLSPTMANDVIKLGFVMSLAFSFPLIIFPCRASLYSFLYKKVHSSQHDHIINHSIPEPTFRCITVAIVAVALFISLLIPNIELVLGLVGSTIGVLICVVFPAACFVNVTFKNTNERVLAKGVLVLGLIIMVLGTYANLEAAESSHDRYDDKYTQERIDKIVEDFFEKRDKDDVFLKPPQTNSMPKEPHKNIIEDDLLKDSEVQPPNPVPPESQSNEKIPDTKLKILQDEEKQLLQMPEKDVDKVSESHPRNLKTKLESKTANGVSNGEAEKPKEPKESKQSNEDKIDMMKQQKLIETIKQHGEEQKELIKEQKEILDEIIKTKKELQQNKNEADTNEAKKIAVESIKQIANMAIKSIGGVSEKPDQVKDEKKDKLEKLTNEAVQEIAKKAAETIEAIQEIKEKPEPPIVPQAAQNGAPVAQANALNPAQNVRHVAPINPEIQQAVNVPVVPPKEIPKQVAASNIVNNVPPNANLQPNIEVKPIANVKPAEVAQKQTVVQTPVKDAQQNVAKPQSYVQGENAAKVEKKIQNVPLPIVQELANNNIGKVQEPVKASNEDIKVNVQQAVNQPVRQKREVVDCEKTVSLKAEDREICEAMKRPKAKDSQAKILDDVNKVAIPQNLDSQEHILPKVDLNDVALPKSLVVDSNALHHIVRSLKSYDKER